MLHRNPTFPAPVHGQRKFWMGNSEDWAQMLMLQLWPYQAARADTAGETLGSSVLRGGGGERKKEQGHSTPPSSQRGQVKCRASQGCFHMAGYLSATCAKSILPVGFLSAQVLSIHTEPSGGNPALI